MARQSRDARTGDRVTRTDEEWRAALTAEQFAALRRGGTERAGTARYAYSREPGAYLCAVRDVEVFHATAKDDSGTGWPSFTQPASSDAVRHIRERGLFGRTEVRCRSCASHLGHVFGDGPRPTGQRDCLNSVALALDPDGDS